MALTARPKHRQTVSEKKRVGQHHKVGKSYTRTYWPYLPMLLVLVAGFVLNVTWNTGQGILGYATSMSASALLQGTNDERAKNGLGGLAINSQLSQAAQAKANDMAARNYWAHVTPDGKQPWAFISSAGYSYQTAGENLAYGFDTSSAAIAGWMNSSEHRANILNTSYKEVGFGIANSPNYQDTGEETIVVAMYASPYVASAPVAQASPTPKASTPAPAAQETPAPTPTAETPVQTTTNSQEAAQQAAAKPETSKKTTAQATEPQPITAKRVARIDVLTNSNAEWASLALSVLATVSILSFVIKHGRLWRRYLIRGETFIIKHPLFDTALVAVAVIGFVLTRSSGFIQ